MADYIDNIKIKALNPPEISFEGEFFVSKWIISIRNDASNYNFYQIEKKSLTDYNTNVRFESTKNEIEMIIKTESHPINSEYILSLKYIFYEIDKNLELLKINHNDKNDWMLYTK